MLDRVDLPVGDDDVGGAVDDRLHEVADAVLGVLVVAVGVHQDVGPELQGSHDPVVEGTSQTLVAGVVHELGDAVRPRDLHRAVRGTVVDHEDDDLVDPLDLAGDRLQDKRQRLLLVEARDLNDKLHGALSGRWCVQGEEPQANGPASC